MDELEVKKGDEECRTMDELEAKLGNEECRTMDELEFFFGKVRSCSTLETNQFSSNFKLFRKFLSI
jgi:hypothetical protein